MRVVFHIISTGGGGGASRTTRYIAERDKDLTREGPGARPLFSEDREGLTYRNADRILDPLDGQPQKEDLIHLSVSFTEEDFEKLGRDEEERQERLRQVIRDGMKGMAEELNVEQLTWVAGIHRNTDNPHAHVVILNEAVDRGGIEARQIGKIRTSLLPHKEILDGKEVVVPGRIGDRFLMALDRQQEKVLNPDQQHNHARDTFERMVEQIRGSAGSEGGTIRASPDDKLTRQFKSRRALSQSFDYGTVAESWNKHSRVRQDLTGDYRIALGRYLELNTRLAFAEAWHERAVKHGNTYRFEVLDQSVEQERKISELDVHRRASARAQRFHSTDRAAREQAFDAELSRHRETLDELLTAQEAKIAALGKDVSAMRGSVSKVESGFSRRYDTPSDGHVAPIISRELLSELQANAIRLNLPEKVAELEELRLQFAREFRGPLRTDDESRTLAAQLNVARADLLARNERIENFETSVHLAPYEVHGERWSLAALDKQLARRREDSRVVPARAMHLNLRSLTRFNYSPTERLEAAKDVEHLTFLRSEIVRQVEQRREPLMNDRDRAREILDTLEDAAYRDKAERDREGKEPAEPKYEPHQMKSLESSAENLRDPKLLNEVHEWERDASKHSPEIDWEGRAVAREIMAEVSLDETKQRLQHFLDSKRVASLNLGDHRTGTLREVEARTLTDYLVRLLETREQRGHRQSINLAAHEHHGRLISDFEKARDYYAAARELASDSHGREPNFTDKEKINLEIYAERQNDDSERDRYLGLARGDAPPHEHAVSLNR